MAREIKGKGASAASNVTLTTGLTALFFYAFPDFPEEFVIHVPVAIMAALGWIGTTARDAVHDYEKDGAELGWLGRSLVRLLG